MPYHLIDDLPESLRHVLPVHAQEIYLASFNKASEEYKDKSKRRNPEEDLEKICHKIAWAAVKTTYRKDQNGKWVLKT